MIKDMKTIGLTGGTGSGKTTVSAYLRKKGYTVLDADAITRRMTGKNMPLLKKIQAVFGDDIVTGEGDLRRSELSARAFADDEKHHLLMRTVTQAVLEELAAEVEKAKREKKTDILFLDVPLLFESGADRLCDAVWLMTADEQTRVARVAARDGKEPRDVRAMIRMQMRDEEKKKLSDRILSNDGTRAELEQKVDALLKELE